MPFTGKSGKFNAAIRTVEIGTGDKAVKLGGENVLPFYTFDAPIENAPKIGVLITDMGLENEVAGIKDYYAGATTFAEIAKKAEESLEQISLFSALRERIRMARTVPLRIA